MADQMFSFNERIASVTTHLSDDTGVFRQRKTSRYYRYFSQWRRDVIFFEVQLLLPLLLYRITSGPLNSRPKLAKTNDDSTSIWILSTVIRAERKSHFENKARCIFIVLIVMCFVFMARALPYAMAQKENLQNLVSVLSNKC